MKRILFTLLCILCFMTCHAQVQQRKVTMADPFIFQEKGKYYLYGTSSDNGIAVLESDNLENWDCSDKNRVLALDKKDSYGDKWFWAPELYKVNGVYYLLYSAEEHICMATGNSPTGPFYNSGRPILEEKGIDCSLFFDENGKVYLYWVRFQKGNVIWSAQFDLQKGKIVEGTEKFCLKADLPWETDLGCVTEGPFVLKHKGTYYLTYSANDFRSKNYGIGYATSDSPDGPWIKYEGNPIFQSPDGLVGVGHHSFFNDGQKKKMKKGGWIVFHSHWDKTRVQPRATHISTFSYERHKGGPDILVISSDYKSLMRK